MENLTVQSEELQVPVGKGKGARSPELENIQKVINLYIDGARNHNVESLKQAFHPQASVFGWNEKDQSLFLASAQALYDHAASTPAPSQIGEPTTFIITSMHVSGHAASVEMVMDSYLGCDYMDYFQLLKVDGRWWIVSKTFHADPQSV